MNRWILAVLGVATLLGIGVALYEPTSISMESPDHERRSEMADDATASRQPRRRVDPPSLSAEDERVRRLAKERRKMEFLTNKLEELEDDRQELLQLEGAEVGLETLRGHQERLRRELAATESVVAELERGASTPPP